jgi:hypothetical protein
MEATLPTTKTSGGRGTKVAVVVGLMAFAFVGGVMMGQSTGNKKEVVPSALQAFTCPKGYTTHAKKWFQTGGEFEKFNICSKEAVREWAVHHRNGASNRRSCDSKQVASYCKHQTHYIRSSDSKKWGNCVAVASPDGKNWVGLRVKSDQTQTGKPYNGDLPLSQKGDWTVCEKQFQR